MSAVSTLVLDLIACIWMFLSDIAPILRRRIVTSYSFDEVCMNRLEIGDSYLRLIYIIVFGLLLMNVDQVSATIVLNFGRSLIRELVVPELPGVDCATCNRLSHLPICLRKYRISVRKLLVIRVTSSMHSCPRHKVLERSR